MADERAIVLIGVRRTGDLPELQAVERGLDAMAAWARDQGMPDELVVECSDRDGQPVTALAVATAITDLVARPSLRQLVVYFAGHGVNNGQSEYWLLSGAPAMPGEAVNVAGSAVLAERLPVPHVVFVSDACRTAPAGIRALGVTGTVVVPNLAPTGPASQVDQFYACLLGSPANEIADSTQAAGAYASLYTEVLVEALRGEHADLIEPAPVDPSSGDVDAQATAAPMALVRPWPLKRGLPELALQRLVDTGAYLTVNQQPDARVTSDPQSAWLSRVVAERETTGTDDRTIERGGGAPPVPVPSPPGRAPGPTAPTGDAARIARSVEDVLDGRNPNRRPRGDRASADVLARFDDLAQSFGPDHMESGCGVKVRGGTIVGGRARDATAEVLGDDLLRVWPEQVGPVGSPGPPTLVVTSIGVVAVPMIHGFLVALTISAGDLVDLAWQPMAGTELGREWAERADDLGRVRAALATATALGADPVGAERIDDLLAWGRDAVAFDPAMAIVLGRFLRDVGRRRAAVELRNLVVATFGLTLVDLEVVADLAVPGPAAVPHLPLLSRTWPLYEVLADPGPDPDLAAARQPTTWATYQADLLVTHERAADVALGLARTVPPGPPAPAPLPSG